MRALRAQLENGDAPFGRWREGDELSLVPFSFLARLAPACCLALFTLPLAVLGAQALHEFLAADFLRLCGFLLIYGRASLGIGENGFPLLNDPAIPNMAHQKRT